MLKVAREAGVSLMTVSRALRGHPSVLPATRRKVQAVAARLGYRPDPKVSNLMGYLRRRRLSGPETIAWITSHSTKDGWKAVPYLAELFAGAFSRADGLGYHLEPFWLEEPGMSDLRMSNILRSRGVRGLIMAPLEHSRRVDLAWENFASATCGHSLTEPKIHRASNHQYHAMQVAWTTLRAQGFQRIGLVLTYEADLRMEGMWRAGFLFKQEEVPAHDRVPVLLTKNWEPGLIETWYQHYRPDAIISSNRVVDALMRINVHVPDHVAFANFNSLDAGDYAGVDHHMMEIGAAAVDLVAEQLNAGRFGLPPTPKTVMIESGWHPAKWP